MHFKFLQTEIPRETMLARRTVKLDQKKEEEEEEEVSKQISAQLICQHDQPTTSALAVLIFSIRLV